MKKLGRPEFLNGGKSIDLDVVAQFVQKFIGRSTEVFRLLESVILRPHSLDELAQTYSKATDRIILDGQDEGLKFVGGKFCIAYVSSERIGLSMEAYFQNKEGKWIKKTNEAEISSVKITDDAFDELKRDHTIEYELEAPQR